MSTTRIFAVIAAATLALASACSSDADESSASSDSTCPNGQIRFGIEPYEDAAVLTPIYQKMGDALEQKLNCPVEVSIADTYVAEILAMKSGELELGQFGPLGYVFADRQAGAIPLVSFANEDGSLSTYTGAIWVPKDSDISSVEDLAGHTLALSEPGSTSGDAVPRKAMIDAGVDGDVQTEYAGGHTEALLALVNGKVDAAEINSQTLASATAEGSFDESQYTKIWESEPIANDPITVSPETSPEFQDAVKQALLSLDKQDVAAIGKYLDFTSGASPIVAVSKDDYQPVIDLAESLGLTPQDL